MVDFFKNPRFSDGSSENLQKLHDCTQKLTLTLTANPTKEISHHINLILLSYISHLELELSKNSNAQNYALLYGEQKAFNTLTFEQNTMSEFFLSLKKIANEYFIKIQTFLKPHFNGAIYKLTENDFAVLETFIGKTSDNTDYNRSNDDNVLDQFNISRNNAINSLTYSYSYLIENYDMFHISPHTCTIHKNFFLKIIDDYLSELFGNFQTLLYTLKQMQGKTLPGRLNTTPLKTLKDGLNKENSTYKKCELVFNKNTLPDIAHFHTEGLLYKLSYWYSGHYSTAQLLLENPNAILDELCK